MTHSYELALVLRPSLEEEAQEQLIARFVETITAQGGTPGPLERWGKRHLAYEIDGEQSGTYVFLPFVSEPSLPSELNRIARIQEGVLRHHIIRLNDEEEAETAVEEEAAPAAAAAEPDTAPAQP